MHLRYPDPFGDLGLRHVLEESKHQNRLLAFGKRRQQWADRFDVEHLIEIGVEISEAVPGSDRPSSSSPAPPARPRNRVEYALDAICACTTSSRSIPKWMAISVAVGARPNCWDNSSRDLFSCTTSSLSLRGTFTDHP